METSVHVHVNVHELRAALPFAVDVDVVVDVHVDVDVDVVGFFIPMRLRRPGWIRRIRVNPCPIADCT